MNSDELQQHLRALDAWARLDPGPAFAQLKRRIDRLTTAEAERSDRHLEEIEATETAYQAACAARSDGDYDTVEQELRRAALGGHPEAAYELAALLVERGHGSLSVDRDDELLREAAAWLLEAMDAGAAAPEDLEDDLQKLWWIAPRLVAYSDDQIEKLASPVSPTQPFPQSSYGLGRSSSLGLGKTISVTEIGVNSWRSVITVEKLASPVSPTQPAEIGVNSRRSVITPAALTARRRLVACDGPVEPTRAAAPTGSLILLDCCAGAVTDLLSDGLLGNPYPPIDGYSGPSVRLLRVLKRRLRRRSVLTDTYTQYGRFPVGSYSVGFTFRAVDDIDHIDVVPLLGGGVVSAREESESLWRRRRELLSLSSMAPAAVLFDSHAISPAVACRWRSLEFDLLSP